MNQPIPNDRLKKMLAGAKAVMKKVESNTYTTGHINKDALSEDTIGSLEYDPNTTTKMTIAEQEQQQSYETQEEYEAAVKNSKLPPQIKEAMIRNRIPQVGISALANSAFSLSDVEDLVEKPMGQPRTPKTNPIKRQIAESHRAVSDTMNVTREELSEIVSDLVNEKLLEFFMKRISEDAVKKTISVLIKEGKIKKTL